MLLSLQHFDKSRDISTDHGRSLHSVTVIVLGVLRSGELIKLKATAELSAEGCSSNLVLRLDTIKGFIGFLEQGREMEVKEEERWNEV